MNSSRRTERDKQLVRRLPYLCLAYGAVGVGAVGIVLPLLPTTPFLLVAAWAAPKGSRRLNVWLRRHQRFGPVLRAWRQQRAVPRNAKQLAVILLITSWLMLWAGGFPLPVLGLTAALFLTVGTFVCTRPTATRNRSQP